MHFLPSFFVFPANLQILDMAINSRFLFWETTWCLQDEINEKHEDFVWKHSLRQTCISANSRGQFSVWTSSQIGDRQVDSRPRNIVAKNYAFQRSRNRTSINVRSALKGTERGFGFVFLRFWFCFWQIKFRQTEYRSTTCSKCFTKFSSLHI